MSNVPQTLQDLIKMMRDEKIPFTIVSVHDEQAAVYEYNNLTDTFIKKMKCKDYDVCTLWGYPADCNKCMANQCKKYKELSFDYVLSLSSYWTLLSVSLDTKTILVSPNISLVVDLTKGG